MSKLVKLVVLPNRLVLLTSQRITSRVILKKLTRILILISNFQVSSSLIHQVTSPSQTWDLVVRPFVISLSSSSIWCMVLNNKHSSPLSSSVKRSVHSLSPWTSVIESTSGSPLNTTISKTPLHHNLSTQRRNLRQDLARLLLHLLSKVTMLRFTGIMTT